MAVSALLIAGPTASGKSGLAIALAQKLGGAIINADSVQVYRDLVVLSARPSGAEIASAPHHLFGHVDGAVHYSIGFWLKEMAQALHEVRAAGRLPIIVGGTGLYFKALTQGLSEIPAVPADIRTAIRALGDREDAPSLHARLATCDPVMAARLRPSDPQRILRALEIFAATGRSLAHFQGARTAPLLPEARGLFLMPDREALRARIDARFDAMLAAGALAEVDALASRGLDHTLPITRAHGVPPLMAYLRGEMTLDQAVHIGKADTRTYAKRQMTFARHQLPGLEWAAPEAAPAAAKRMAEG